MILVITYKNRKIEKICTDAKVAEKTYGKKMAEKYRIESVKLRLQ